MIETPFPKDSPIMVAWYTYKGTDDYANSLKWASRLEFREGSLWAAFVAGYQSAEAERDKLQGIIDEMRQHPEGALFMAWRDRADDLRAALNEYGQHKRMCSLGITSKICDCGFDAVLSGVPTKGGEG